MTQTSKHRKQYVKPINSCCSILPSPLRMKEHVHACQSVSIEWPSILVADVKRSRRKLSSVLKLI